MIGLFTDFGPGGPYVGQVKARIWERLPRLPVVDLMHDAPRFDPRPGAYLLAALAPELPAGSVLLCVVDPGVGTAARRPVVVHAAGRWFVGPDNGLLHVVAQRGGAPRRWEILWRPARLSASFHGRDLFAPVAVALFAGEPLELAERPWTGAELEQWPADLPEVVYLDHYGNAMTGLRAAALAPGSALAVAGRLLVRARTFGEVPPGRPFWYENANGLAELALNGGSVAQVLGLRVGDPVRVVPAAA
jgi:hypothetical protein